MNLQFFGRIVLISALGLSGCHPKRNAVTDEETIKTQREQISRLIELSKKQSEQIERLAGALEAEKKQAAEPGDPPNAAAVQRQVPGMNPFPIAGSAYITRSSGGSSVLRDLRVMLLSNAQIRWSAFVKDGATYSSGGIQDARESRLRSDLAQFSANVNDLIAAYATTDADGKYKFANVAPGDYYLFAQYSGIDSTICWFIPVSVQQGGPPMEVNLANSTAYAIAWREVK
ncbi:MAG: hypothetical protein WCH43_08200 [Verrucomicrobiota bacterium]